MDERVTFDSPVGPLQLTLAGPALARVDFVDLRPTAPPARWGHPVVDALRAYFGGDVEALAAIELAPPVGTPFQRAVWEALRAVPPGTTVSYGRLAATIGRPRAVRAVGTANGANPMPVVVPCHRVVRSDGTIGGYGGGLHRKRWLLRHEQQAAAGRDKLRA